MKVTHLFYTAVFAAATWAHSQRPLVFFAKVGDQYVPLSSTSSEDTSGNAKVLTYGDGLSDPTKFTLQGKNAFAIHEDTKKILGNSEGYLVYYDQSLKNVPKYIPTEVVLDRERRLSNGPFYSCARSNKKLHVIRYQDDSKGNGSCFKVDIFLLPYRKNPGSVDKHDLLSEGTESDPKLMDSSVKPDKSSDSSIPGICEFDLSAIDDDAAAAAAAAEKLPYEGKHPSARKINETECLTTDCVHAKNSSKINEYSKPNATAPKKECDECEADFHVTAWKTYTDYTTYCPEATTVTVIMCKEACKKTTLSVANATTLTMKGVYIVPETPTAKGLESKPTARASNLKQSNDYAPKPTKAYQPKANKEAALKASKEVAPEPSVSYFNGASRNAIGACFFGFAALLL